MHYSAIQVENDEFATLNEDDKVTFEIHEGAKGPEARNVVVTEHAPRKERYQRRDSW